ncbi:hypothetical protein B0H17DRAFT_1136806 [Mycena rosella]|uniref:Uncharacterized protein n=1 Tax=Mycena rosella TaxID=1033263 RepID=A0AAD7GFQ8_MYCRO|nr:hypothetical protein B0H17DRAFT_1136806 [Mycena rosella]
MCVVQHSDRKAPATGVPQIRGPELVMPHRHIRVHNGGAHMGGGGRYNDPYTASNAVLLLAANSLSQCAQDDGHDEHCCTSHYCGGTWHQTLGERGKRPQCNLQNEAETEELHEVMGWMKQNTHVLKLVEQKESAQYYDLDIASIEMSFIALFHFYTKSLSETGM